MASWFLCVFQVSRNLEVLRSGKVYGGEAWKDWNAKSEGSPAFWRSQCHSMIDGHWWYLEMTVQAPLGTCFTQYTGKGSVGASSTALRRPWTKVTIWSLPYICSFRVPGQVCIGQAISEHLLFFEPFCWHPDQCDYTGVPSLWSQPRCDEIHKTFTVPVCFFFG